MGRRLFGALYGVTLSFLYPSKKRRSDGRGIPRPNVDKEGNSLCYHNDADDIDIVTFVPSNKNYLSGTHYENHKSMLPHVCIKCGEAYPR